MFALVLLLVSQAHYVACLESSFNSELVENVCKIKSNTTLKNDFYDYVKNAYIPPGSKRIRGSNYYVPEDIIDLYDRYEIKPQDWLLPFRYGDSSCTNRGADEVQWCLHIWHPTQDITTCVNATDIYSTPYALAFGRLEENDLEYNEDCNQSGCLVIKHASRFLEHAYVTMSIQSGACSVYDFYRLRINPVSPNAPVLSYFPPQVMYAEIGKRLTTQCRFGTVIFTNAGKWSVSTAATDDDVLQPIPEHPDCDLLNSKHSSRNSLPYCFNNSGEHQFIEEARMSRVRSYQVVKSSGNCFVYKYSEIFLQVDDVRFGDEGNYTCYSETNDHMRTSFTVHLIPIYPIYEPVLKTYNDSSIVINQSYNQFSLICEVVAGFDTKVYWVLPNKEIDPEVIFVTDLDEENACDSDCYNNSTSYVISINTVLNSTTHTMLFYRKLTVFRNTDETSSDSTVNSGKYKCVAEYNMTGEVKYKTVQTQVTILEPTTILPLSSSDTTSTATLEPSQSQTAETSSRSSVHHSSLTDHTSYSHTPTSVPSASSIGSSADSLMTDNFVIMLSIIVSGIILLVVVVFFVLLAFVIHKRYHCDSTANVLYTDSLPSKGSFIRDNSVIMKDPSTKGSSRPSGFKNPLSEREIDREKIEFVNKIDEGTFGQVVKAILHSGKKNKENNFVAIKMTKESLFSRTYDDVLNIKEELDVMLSIQHHENVVNLIGHCTTSEGPFSIVMEFVPLGNLRDYLRSIAPSMFTFPVPYPPPSAIAPHNRVIMTNSGVSSSSSCSSGHPLLPVSVRPLSHAPLSAQPSEVSTQSYVCYSSDVATPQQATPTRELFSPSTANNSNSSFVSSSSSQDSSPSHKWMSPQNSVSIKKSLPGDVDFGNYALQIAKGLDHLQSMKVIHCDLAARNILIAKDFTLKIGDFGMAKILGQDKDYHTRCRRDKIPVKWTAPEALESWRYTHKSDIWSYGVVLWEMVSFGGIPYSSIPNHSAWDLMINYLKDGHRLHRPSSCPQSLYDVMMNCWKLSPEERPSAEELVKLLNNTSSSSSRH